MPSSRIAPRCNYIRLRAEAPRNQIIEVVSRKLDVFACVRPIVRILHGVVVICCWILRAQPFINIFFFATQKQSKHQISLILYIVLIHVRWAVFFLLFAYTYVIIRYAHLNIYIFCQSSLCVEQTRAAKSFCTYYKGATHLNFINEEISSRSSCCKIENVNNAIVQQTK